MRLSIRARLFALSLISSVGMVLIGMAGLFSVHQATLVLNDIVESDVPALKALSVMQAAQLNLVAQTYSTTTWQNVNFAQQQYGEILARRKQSLSRLQEARHAFESLKRHPGLTEIWSRLQPQWQLFASRDRAIGKVIQQMAEADDPEAMKPLFDAYFQQIAPWVAAKEPVDASLELLARQAQQSSEEARAEAAGLKRRAMLWIGASLAGLLVLLGAGSWLLIRSVTRPLAMLRTTMLATATDSDFTLRAAVLRQDEVGDIATAFNHLATQLQRALKQIRSDAEQLHQLVAQTDQAAQAVGEASDMQSDSASAVAASVEQMTVSVSLIADNAREATAHASQATEVAEAGTRAIQGSLAQLLAIETDLEKANDTVSRVRSQAVLIGPVMQVIKEVADQTNLLALNAAIEAARAGEAGRGFAVVADEVRKLAERTARSTQEINQLIEAIDQYSIRAVEDMKTVVSRVTDGRQTSDHVSQHIQGIVDSSSKVSIAMSEISHALLEQDATVHAVAAQMEAIATSSEGNRQTAQATTAVSRRLSDLADSFHKQVQCFSV
ncbi:methyl-accepting chemotaxis protein [Leeia oryzae]|uniref:methyl-accepting chemotaxis protein n=1 Tax=Leeia oryzae TaxID=356662 RepID=UPI0003A207A0|nr:methyl-accepting chemotaxis protein [Leeia oryzae]